MGCSPITTHGSFIFLNNYLFGSSILETLLPWRILEAGCPPYLCERVYRWHSSTCNRSLLRQVFQQFHRDSNLGHSWRLREVHGTKGVLASLPWKGHKQHGLHLTRIWRQCYLNHHVSSVRGLWWEVWDPSPCHRDTESTARTLAQAHICTTDEKVWQVHL